MATPSSLNEQLSQALSLHQQGLLNEAEPFYQAVLQIEPSNPMALNMLGTLWMQKGNLDQGITLIEKSLAANPAQPEPLVNIGNAYYLMGKFDDSLDACNRALSYLPGYPLAHNIKGNSLNALNRLDESIASYQQAIASNPELAEPHYNLGTTYKQLQRYPEAIASFKSAIRLIPDLAEAHNNLGTCYQDTNACQQAIESYDQAIRINPGFTEAVWNKALMKLILGEYAEGWQLYESGWEGETSFRGQPHSFSEPLWLGNEPIAGKTLLLWAEQGFGDTIQFCRYALMVKEQGANVVLSVQPSLVTLLQTLDSDITVIEQGKPLPVFDYHCPLMSLPLALKTTLESIPASTPYLFALPQYQKKWRGKAGASGLPVVGIAWSGSPKDENDRNRSISLDALRPLLEMPFEFHCLQKELTPSDSQQLESYLNVHIHAPAISSFADTAALIAEMDLVISVDTSVAHVAAAMDKQVWILLSFAPDFRWLLEKRDSPWYPSALLYRQPSIGNWPAVIKQVCEKLQELTQG